MSGNDVLPHHFKLALVCAEAALDSLEELTGHNRDQMLPALLLAVTYDFEQRYPDARPELAALFEQLGAAVRAPDGCKSATTALTNAANDFSDKLALLMDFDEVSQ